MDHAHAAGSPDKPLLTAIIVILIVYAVAAAFGWPQAGAEKIKQAAAAEHAEKGETTEHAAQPAPEDADAPGHAPAIAKTPPPYWMVIPFVLLLGAIAILPLVPLTEHWWDNNRNRFKVAAALGALTLLYYLFLHHSPIDGHFPVHYIAEPSPGALNWSQTFTVLANAMLNEYIPFIMLLFSLYTISGGIRITGDLQARPMTNTTFLAVGSVLASFIGTTGAAMLLIRPLLETNRQRKFVVHTIVFFIFVVCNCGGCLLPLGDPPLFLGYLQGVDFLWTLNLWKEWLFVNGLLVAAYFLLDRFWYYPRESAPDVALDETRVSGLKIAGLWPNALLLLGVVLSIALLDPNKTVPLTDFRPWVYLREVVQLALVGLSLHWGDKTVRQENNFNYHAIIEVAALFSGIFIAMQPALQILSVRGPDLGLHTPAHFFWATGSLSSVLDNAPTYVVFFETAQTIKASPGATFMAGVEESLLVAVSLGAVFMGSMTYIGNGPNFMVRAIAEKSGIPMPSFFGYMLWSCLILLPILALTTLLFL